MIMYEMVIEVGKSKEELHILQGSGQSWMACTFSLDIASLEGER